MSDSPVYELCTSDCFSCPLCLGGKGSLRRGRRRALASCAPFCTIGIRDGPLRREPDRTQTVMLILFWAGIAKTMSRNGSNRRQKLIASANPHSAEFSIN